jgi:O-antigen ligase
MTSPDFLATGVLTRMGSMKLGIDIFLDHPWTGVGFNGFATHVWNYSPGLVFDLLIENYVALAANQVIQTATDGGLIGLSVFLFMIARFIRSHARAIRMQGDGDALDFACFQVWTLAMLLGNQTAVWLINNSLVAYYVFLLAGISEKYARLATHESV